jgi:type III pantothenate kinase
MFLAIDIGNTKIKTGIFQGEELKQIDALVKSEDIIKLIKKNSVTKIAISSVVPQMLDEINTQIKNQIHLTPFIISKNCKFNLTLNYDSLDTLGIDRICSSEGAFYLFKLSNDFEKFDSSTFLITIDFGTATTINLIKHPGEFIGGIISPGLQMMFESLKTKTAQLPEVSLVSYVNLIGKDTMSSIASGVVNSITGLVEKILKYVKSELGGDKIFVYITGGKAVNFQKYLQFDFKYERGLVLYGIKSLYGLNQ